VLRGLLDDGQGDDARIGPAAARRADSSRRFRAARASPLAQRAMASRPPRRLDARAAEPALRVGQGPGQDLADLWSERGWRTRTLVRESNGAITSKEGFSVVAPMRVMVPRST